jgi:RNA polymerase sigma factor (TIGR02999 family)
MTSPRSKHLTDLLRAWSAGERDAFDELLPLVYNELHRLAARAMRGQPDGHTLQTTALVHEAYLRLVDREVGPESVVWQSRAHFFAVAARAMRSVLVDHARARRAAKRGGGRRRLEVTVAPDGADQERNIDVIALDEALGRLAEMDQRKVRLVELRFFTGLGIEDAAEVLGISPATVKREWSMARAWLRRELGASHDTA